METRKSTPDGLSERLPYLAIFSHHAPPFGWGAVYDKIVIRVNGEDDRAFAGGCSTRPKSQNARPLHLAKNTLFDTGRGGRGAKPPLC